MNTYLTQLQVLTTNMYPITKTELKLVIMRACDKIKNLKVQTDTPNELKEVMDTIVQVAFMKFAKYWLKKLNNYKLI